MFVDIEQLPSAAKVWIYQANKPLDNSTQHYILEKTKAFIESWDSHGRALKGSAAIYYSYFLILAVDEAHAGVSGCSIDKSVHFIKELGQELNIDFFDRTRQAFIQNGDIIVENFKNLKTHINVGMIKRDTLTFDNTVSNLEEFYSSWQVPASQSWLAKYFA
ncbi:hypothetical protein Q0590_07555 [Rhodocytophaga aerolata]|uniref:ABC transporter ATPase n=1 Tax=Rhodocytophaga aerolata TaxID=455078 RepID=A0ABT8R1X3_9BACT|nr:hypothetical protein [Rhodocytophaga aerolata]MDO1446101.1 hypothetical protein [Rhodocytophaga aerolata]